MKWFIKLKNIIWKFMFPLVHSYIIYLWDLLKLSFFLLTLKTLKEYLMLLMKFSVFVWALQAALLSYSIGIELLTFLDEPTRFSVFQIKQKKSSSDFRIKSPEAMTFNDGFDTQGHDNDFVVVVVIYGVWLCDLLLSLVSWLLTVFWLGQMINLSWLSIYPGGPFTDKTLCNNHK